MKNPSNLFDTCNDHYTRTFDEVQMDKSVLISYFGEFYQSRLNHLLEKMEASLAMLNESKRSGKRVFSVTVEGLQNIKLHGNKSPEGKLLGLFMLSYNKKEYDIRFGNLVNQEGKDHLTKEINKINSLNPEDLREYHKEVLFNGDISSKGGAGLGLIISSMKSKGELNPEFIKLADDLYFYNLHIVVECGL